MARYKIRINYSTGDSNNDYKASDVLEIEWDNLDIAKENLKAIKDHYVNVYKKIHSHSAAKNNQEICKEHESKWWFVKVLKPFCKSGNYAISEKQKEKHKDDWENRFDEYAASSQIRLTADSGYTMQISCFWCGHFESLEGAEIEEDKAEMKFEL
jgi:hypothetical protein